MKRLAVALAIATLSSPALGGGLYLSERGVRPNGRGGAFVAGADDLHAIWFNPAGLADAKSSLLLDLSVIAYGSTFTRVTNVEDSGGTIRTYTSGPVSGSGAPVPIPTIGGTINFGDQKQWTAAFGLFSPYTPLATWPETVNGQPAPSRYSLVTLEGSLLVVIGGWLAWKPIEQLRIGAGLEVLTGSFRDVNTLNANPNDRVLGAPEDPQYDSLAQLTVSPIFTPSGNLGATWVPMKELRVGLSAQLPFWIDAPGSIKVRLPTAAPFDNASQQGDSVGVAFKTPGILRAGVEIRPVERLRLELSYVHEFWNMHDEIGITPHGVALVNITGFPSPFYVAPISIQRKYQDTNSIRFGGEYRFPFAEKNTFDLRWGLNFESTAIPNEYISPLGVDWDKLALSGGVGFHVGPHWRFDFAFTHIVGSSIYVDPAKAQAHAVNPVKGNPTSGPVAINGGYYDTWAEVIGLGAEYKF